MTAATLRRRTLIAKPNEYPLLGKGAADHLIIVDSASFLVDGQDVMSLLPQFARNHGAGALINDEAHHDASASSGR